MTLHARIIFVFAAGPAILSSMFFTEPLYYLSYFSALKQGAEVYA